MKKIILIVAYILCFVNTINAQKGTQDKLDLGKKLNAENISPSGIIRCSTDENEEILQRNNPKRMTRDQFNTFIAPYVQQY
jgi:hypothetical protein